MLEYLGRIARDMRTAGLRRIGGTLAVVGLGCLGCLAPVGPSMAQTRDISALTDALATVSGGETIRLPGGNYGTLQLIDGHQGMDARFSAMVTITSADPSDPAVFTGVDVRGAANLTFDGVVFDYTYQTGDSARIFPFEFSEVSDVTLRNLVIDGDTARGTAGENDGYGWGTGLRVRRSTDVTIENSDIYGFWRGLTVGASQNIVIRGNDIHLMRSEGMNFIANQGLLIENNYIHDFRRNLEGGGHSDMIQFWTARQDTPATDITIRGNVLMSVEGTSAQAIFMRNEVVDQGKAGEEMFYRNVIIENNIIINRHSHGITLGGATGVLIANNTVLHDPSASTDRTIGGRPPGIRVKPESVNVVIMDNITARAPDEQPGWLVAGNLIAQNVSLLRPNHYSVLFRDTLRGDPNNLDSYAYLPAVPPGIGAPQLRNR